MPVHRHLHDKMGSVYAFQSELDAWMRGRSDQPPPGAAEPGPADPAGTQHPTDKPTFRSRWPAIAVAAALGAVAIGSMIEFERSDHFWRNPFAGAAFQSVTGFDGRNEAAAVSRDGQFIAFLSDRGGRTDVWVTQVGSGRFHNLTQGLEGELGNPAIRELGFSPDGSLVTFWLAPAVGRTGRRYQYLGGAYAGRRTPALPRGSGGGHLVARRQ